MKKLLLLPSLLILAACAAAPTNSPSTVATNRNDNAAESAPAMTEADAIAKEKAIWDTIKQKDYDAFGAMLADDQLEVLPEGVMDKPGTVSGVKDFEPTEINFTDWKYTSIDKDAFLVSYTVAVKGKYQGKEFPLESARASSAWTRRAGKWLAIYHQETPIAKMPPPPPPKPAAKATPTPEAVTGTTGPDPIANEKLVWDMFKARNYEAFGNLLAPDFHEVEPDKVHDRASTIQGVSRMDASKAVLSDWKSVKISADSALVTYTVKGVGGPPDGERHSSIWASRNGKWMGLFHQGGTPVRKPAPTPAPKASPSPSASPK